MLLSRAGAAPARVSERGTYRVAECLGTTDEFETVAVGKMADLILLDADPLLDIHNTTRSDHVILGEVLERNVGEPG